MSESPIRVVLAVMTISVSLIIAYFIVSPSYYTTLDILNSTLYEEAAVGSNARTFTAQAYNIFYYGLSSLIVIGLLATVAWLYMYIRRRYFSTEEAYYS